MQLLISDVVPWRTCRCFRWPRSATGDCTLFRWHLLVRFFSNQSVKSLKFLFFSSLSLSLSVCLPTHSSQARWCHGGKKVTAINLRVRLNYCVERLTADYRLRPFAAKKVSHLKTKVGVKDGSRRMTHRQRCVMSIFGSEISAFINRLTATEGEVDF